MTRASCQSLVCRAPVGGLEPTVEKLFNCSVEGEWQALPQVLGLCGMVSCGTLLTLQNGLGNYRRVFLWWSGCVVCHLAGYRVGIWLLLFWVRFQLNLRSSKSVQVLHPDIAGSGTSVTSKVIALLSPLWCTYNWQEPRFLILCLPTLWWTKLPFSGVCCHFLIVLLGDYTHLCTCVDFAYYRCGVPVG